MTDPPHHQAAAGRRPADNAPVLVIDLQTGMFDGVVELPIAGAAELVARVRAVLDWARRTSRAIAFVRHDGTEGDPLAPGAPGWPIWPDLGRAEDEPIFAKSVGDAFSNPGLGVWVADQDADEIILLGAQTDACVAATVAGARAAGLQVTVVSDAHSTWPSADETAAAIIARHNAGFAAVGATVVTTQALTDT